MKINKLFQNGTIEYKAKKFYDSKKVRRLRRYNHPIVREHVIYKINFIKKYIKLTPKTRVLEVGAGNGYFSYYLSDSCNLLVTDVNKETLLLNPVKEKIIADANKTPFKDNSFDVVICIDILHHVDNPDKVINEIIRVSKKYIVIMDANSNSIFTLLFAFFPREWGHFRFTTKRWKKLLNKKNLKVIKFQPLGRLTTPNMPLPLSLVRRLPYSSSPQLNFHNLAICKK